MPDAIDDTMIFYVIFDAAAIILLMMLLIMLRCRCLRYYADITICHAADMLDMLRARDDASKDATRDAYACRHDVVIQDTMLFCAAMAPARARHALTSARCCARAPRAMRSRAR